MGPGFESLRAYFLGEMAEWSIASVLKTDVLRGTGGSNPSLSAERQRISKFGYPFLYCIYCSVWCLLSASFLVSRAVEPGFEGGWDET